MFSIGKIGLEKVGMLGHVHFELLNAIFHLEIGYS